MRLIRCSIAQSYMVDRRATSDPSRSRFTRRRLTWRPTCRSGYGTTKGCGDRRSHAPLAVPLAVQTSARGGPAQLAELVDSNLWQGHPAFRCGVAVSANGQSPNSAPVTSYPAEAPPVTMMVSFVCGARV